MLPRGGKSLLIALVACVQLVLAPAYRPAACNAVSTSGGGHSCCAAPVEEVFESAAAEAARSCCCGDHESPMPERDRAPGDPRCPCQHAPQPWAPADDAVAVSSGVHDKLAGSGPIVSAVPLEATAVVRIDPGVGPPSRAGPALHVLHCVFLI